jgi:hypothetical protein
LEPFKSFIGGTAQTVQQPNQLKQFNSSNSLKLKHFNSSNSSTAQTVQQLKQFNSSNSSTAQSAQTVQ